MINALDEASDPEPFLDVFRKLVIRECGTPIAVLVSSRNSTNLENLLILAVTKHVLIPSEANNDVRNFITTEINKRFTSEKLNVLNVELIDLTISKLVTRADELFLQANLLLDFVFAGKTSRLIRKALTELSNSLEETYETILRRITSQNRRHVNEIRRCLQWLSISFVPITLPMLVEAAASDPNDSFLDTEACMDGLDLVGMLSSLVLVDWSTTPPVVSLAHQTVLEYLQSQNILRSDMYHYHIDARTTHQYLAETSIQYLQFPDSAKFMMQAARFLPTRNALQSSHHDPFETASTLASAASSDIDLISCDKVRFLYQHSEIHNTSSSRPDTAAQNHVDIGPCLMHATKEQALLNYTATLWPEHLKSSQYAFKEFEQTIAPKLR